MPTTIKSILQEIGPSLSSVIVEHLCRDGLTQEAARQRISRAGGEIKRLRGLKFPNREGFLFLEDQFGRDAYQINLAVALKVTGSAYGKALIGLGTHGGAVAAAHFPIVSGLPCAPTKRQLKHGFVESKLLELGLITSSDSPEGNIIGLPGEREISKRRRAALAVEDIVLAAMKSWLMKVGWTSSNAPTIRSNASPQFGQFKWDLVAPSYLSALVRYDPQKVVPGFIVCDILQDTEITTEALIPFFSKCDVLTHQKRPTRFQPMFIADAFTEDALHQLRARGCFVARPETIFGEETAKQLRELISTIENAAAAVATNPQNVFELITKLSKIEGAVLNLRGIVLELLIAHLYKLDGCNIDIRQQIRSEENDPAEIDVKATSRQEVVCVECKGKSPGALVDAPEIQDWLDRSLPRIKSWLKLSTTLPDQRRFEFYSSTGYTADAESLINHVTTIHKKQPIHFFRGTDIIAKLQKQKETPLVNMFREQFLPH